METRFRDTNEDVIKTDLLMLPVEEKKVEGPTIRDLNRRLKGKLSEQIHLYQLVIKNNRAEGHP